MGPMSDNYEESEDVNVLRKFGVTVDKKMFFQCFIGYISPDGTECMVRWPPPVQRQSDGKSASAMSSGQGSIVPAWTCSLRDLAHQFSSNVKHASANCCQYCLGPFPGAAAAHSCYPDGGGSVGHAPPGVESTTHSTYSPEADGPPSQNWSWHVFHRPG